MRWLQLDRLIGRERIVTPHIDFRAQFAQIMREVVSETVVVIDEQEHDPTL